MKNWIPCLQIFEQVFLNRKLSGYVDVKSKPITFYGDGRIIEASGTFSCMIARKN
jgi:hypothetical protein